MIEVPTGIHLSEQEVRLLLTVLESACRVTTPGARAQHVIAQLRRITRTSGGPASDDLRSRAKGYGTPQYAQYDLVDSREAARLLGITASGVRDLVYRGQLPGHRAGGRWLLPAAPVIERAERRAARRG